MEEFPGISFAWTAIGRQPMVTGSGMTVWELLHVWRDHGRRVPAVLEHYPHLKAAQVAAAVAYARRFASEEPPGLWGRRPGRVAAVRL
jgi:uncharacterized protein (DUF433 family)